MTDPGAKPPAVIQHLRLDGSDLLLHYVPAIYVGLIAGVAWFGWRQPDGDPPTHFAVFGALAAIAVLVALIQRRVLQFEVIATSRDGSDNRDLVLFTATREGWTTLAPEPGGGLRFHVLGARKRHLATLRFDGSDVLVNVISTWGIARLGRGSREIDILRAALLHS